MSNTDIALVCMPALPVGSGGIKQSGHARAPVRLCESDCESSFHLYISWMHGRILMKLITFAHYQVHMTQSHFQGHEFKGQGHRNVLRLRHTNRRFAVNFCLVS